MPTCSYCRRRATSSITSRVRLTGQPLYNMDFKLPGMLYAVVRRSPVSDGQVPLMPHAPMEPMNCTAQYTDGKIEIRAPTQNPGGLAGVVAKAMGISTDKTSEQVIIHIMRSGGHVKMTCDTVTSGRPVYTVSGPG